VTFDEFVARVLELRQREERLSYRALNVVRYAVTTTSVVSVSS
jgi:hypothetical protein